VTRSLTSSRDFEGGGKKAQGNTNQKLKDAISRERMGEERAKCRGSRWEKSRSKGRRKSQKKNERALEGLPFPRDEAEGGRKCSRYHCSCKEGPEGEEKSRYLLQPGERLIGGRGSDVCKMRQAVLRVSKETARQRGGALGTLTFLGRSGVKKSL